MNQIQWGIICKMMRQETKMSFHVMDQKCLGKRGINVYNCKTWSWDLCHVTEERKHINHMQLALKIVVQGGRCMCTISF